MMRTLSRLARFTLTLAALTGSAFAPSSASACPRCDPGEESEALLTGTYVGYSDGTVRVRTGSSVETLRVDQGVSPRRGDEVVAWSSLSNGARLDLVVRTRGEERVVVRAELAS